MTHVGKDASIGLNSDHLFRLFITKYQIATHI